MNLEWCKDRNIYFKKLMLIFTMFMLTLSPAMTMGSFEVYAEDGDDSSESEVINSEENENEGNSNNEGESNDEVTSNENGNNDESNDNSEANENDEARDDDNEGNENGDVSNESNEGNEEEGTEVVENDDGDEERSKVVTPVLPEITEATCDSDPKVFIDDTPIEDGIVYDLLGDIDVENLKPGDTITILAAPYDRYEGEGLVLDIPDGWTEIDDGFAAYEHTFAEPDCEGTEDDEGTGDDDEGTEDDEGTGDDDEGTEDDDGTDDVSSASGKIITIDREGCIVSITTQLEAGDYELQVWDDGVKIDTVTKSVSEAGEYVFTWEIKNPAMESAPGVAFALYEAGAEYSQAYFDYVDPYEYPREVANKCAGVTEDEDQPEGLGGPADASNIDQGEPKVKSEEVTVKSEEELEVVEVTQEGDRLPNTATSLYNIMLYGIGILLLGGVCLFIFRKRKA